MQNHSIASSYSSALLALALALAMGGLCLLSGCASTNGDGATQDESAPVVDVAEVADDFEALRSIGFRLDWRGFAILQADARLQTLAPLGEVVVAQDSRNVITVLEPDTGAIRWADAVPNELDRYHGHFLRENELVSVTQSEITIRDVRNGTLLDRQPLGVLANTDAVMMDPLVFYGSTIGEAVAHNLNTGFKLWGNMLDGTLRAKPALAGSSRVVFASNRGEVLAIDAASGAARGSRNRVFEGLDTHPVADDARAYLASRDRSVWAFNLIDGSQAWRYRTEVPLSSQPVLHDGSLYLFIPGQGFVALNTADGARQWANPDLRGQLVGVRRGRLLVWDMETSELHAVLPTNGSVVSTQRFDNPHFLSVEGFEEPNLYLVYADGGIERYIPR